MFLSESLWIRNCIEHLPLGIKSVLDIGSSDLHSRTVITPYVQENIFEPLIKKNISVVHTDMYSAEGIDIVGDLTDKVFIDTLKKMNFDLVICTNLLEHITNRELICSVINKIVKKNGFCIITVPYRYPYHFAPIDNMYRPDISQLSSEFPLFDIVQGAIVNDDRTYFDMLKNNKKLFRLLIFRSILPFYKPKMWWNTVKYWPYLFKPFRVTCVCLQKR